MCLAPGCRYWLPLEVYSLVSHLTSSGMQCFTSSKDMEGRDPFKYLLLQKDLVRHLNQFTCAM